MVTDIGSENQELSFSHKLLQNANRKRSWLCVGLDPDLAQMPAGIPRNVQGLERFCLEMIGATSGAAAAFKINLAFFEAFGSAGWACLERVRASIPEQFPVIADAKRGDIGNTARAYASAIFDALQFDAVTVNPYLGTDSLEPFFDRRGKGVFVLCRTSNPGSRLIQDHGPADDPLFLMVAREALQAPAFADVGLVVGATQPEALVEIRRRYPHVLLLIPGVGAQGADATTTVRLGADAQGQRALISVSRQILYASHGSDYQQAARSMSLDLAPQTWTQ